MEFEVENKRSLLRALGERITVIYERSRKKEKKKNEKKLSPRNVT